MLVLAAGDRDAAGGFPFFAEPPGFFEREDDVALRFFWSAIRIKPVPLSLGAGRGVRSGGVSRPPPDPCPGVAVRAELAVASAATGRTAVDNEATHARLSGPTVAKIKATAKTITDRSFMVGEGRPQRPAVNPPMLRPGHPPPFRNRDKFVNRRAHTVRPFDHLPRSARRYAYDPSCMGGSSLIRRPGAPKANRPNPVGHARKQSPRRHFNRKRTGCCKTATLAENCRKSSRMGGSREPGSPC